MTFVQRISGNLVGSLLRFAMGVHICIHKCHLYMSVLKAFQFVEASKTWYVLDQLKMNLAGYLFIANDFFISFFSNGYPLSLVFICQENPRRSGILLFCRPSQILPIYRIFARGLSQMFGKRYVYL